MIRCPGGTRLSRPFHSPSTPLYPCIPNISVYSVTAVGRSVCSVVKSGGRTDATSASLPPCTPTDPARHDSLRLVSNLFGLLRPARRLFPPSIRRQRDGESKASLRETVNMAVRQ